MHTARTVPPPPLAVAEEPFDYDNELELEGRLVECFSKYRLRPVRSSDTIQKTKPGSQPAHAFGEVETSQYSNLSYHVACAST